MVKITGFGEGSRSPGILMRFDPLVLTVGAPRASTFINNFLRLMVDTLSRVARDLRFAPRRSCYGAGPQGFLIGRSALEMASEIALRYPGCVCIFKQT